MRRTVVVAAVAAVLVLATPAARRRVGGALDGVAAQVRSRVDSFRADYAARQEELRERLLPEDDVVAAASRHRAESR